MSKILFEEISLDLIVFQPLRISLQDLFPLDRLMYAWVLNRQDQTSVLIWIPPDCLIGISKQIFWKC